MWYMHWVIASAEPLNVTARSVEFGNISLATCMEQPVTSLISLILAPPLPEKKKSLITIMKSEKNKWRRLVRVSECIYVWNPPQNLWPYNRKNRYEKRIRKEPEKPTSNVMSSGLKQKTYVHEQFTRKGKWKWKIN